MATGKNKANAARQINLAWNAVKTKSPEPGSYPKPPSNNGNAA